VSPYALLSPEQVLFYTGEAKYDVVMECAKHQGWTAVSKKDPEKDDCNVYWVDIAVVPDRLAKLKPWQCCNHFPGNWCVCARTNCCRHRPDRQQSPDGEAA
jgi:hypothetical protein